MGVKAKPDGYNTATPYLHIKGVPAAIEFYKEAFGAVETMRLEMAPGVVAHAEIKIGDSVIMMSEENPEWGNKGPSSYGGSPVSLMLYVEDCDAVVARAVAAGAKPLRPVATHFYGDRSGCVTDPFGHVWSVSTHVEDVSYEECKRRMTTAMSSAPAA